MSNFDSVVRFPSKKAFAAHVAEVGAENVMVTDTSLFSSRGTISVAELRPADVIVGPDAYRDRRWYANAKPKTDKATGQTRIAIV